MQQTSLSRLAAILGFELIKEERSFLDNLNEVRVARAQGLSSLPSSRLRGRFPGIETLQVEVFLSHSVDSIEPSLGCSVLLPGLLSEVSVVPKASLLAGDIISTPLEVSRFEQRYLVSVSEERVGCALLGHEERELLERFFARHLERFSFLHGRVSLNIVKERSEEETVQALFEELRPLVELLLKDGAEEEGMLRRLRRFGHHDPHFAFRARCMRLWLTHGDHEDAELRKDAKASLEHYDSGVRLAAALVLGGEQGFEVLKGVIIDREADDRWRIQALHGLRDKWKKEPGYPALLEELIEQTEQEVLKEVLKEVLRVELSLSFEQLFGAYRRGGASPALVQLLKRCEEVGAEELLCGMLDSPEELSLEVIRALRSCGSLRAVESLLPLTSGFLRSGKVKQAAREAIGVIQVRCGGEVGGLSLAESVAESGHLAIVKAPTGGLSAPAEEADE